MSTDPVTIEIYDCLSKVIDDVAVLVLGDRHIIGRWVMISENSNGYILPMGRRAIKVLGEGDSWAIASDGALVTLGRSLDKKDKRACQIFAAYVKKDEK